jgi:hypothetical protein
VTVEQLVDELPELIARKKRIEVNAGYDLSPHLLDRITDRLVSEVLI